MKLLISLLRQRNLFEQLIDLVDEDGNTALQLATARKRNQMRKILLRETNINDNDHKKVVNMDPAHSVPIDVNESHGRKNFLESLKSGMIVLCTLFATVCFDAVLYPPGGVWQDRPSSDVFNATNPDNPNNISYFVWPLNPKNLRSEDLLAPNKAMNFFRSSPLMLCASCLHSLKLFY